MRPSLTVKGSILGDDRVANGDWGLHGSENGPRMNGYMIVDYCADLFRKRAAALGYAAAPRRGLQMCV